MSKNETDPLVTRVSSATASQSETEDLLEDTCLTIRQVATYLGRSRQSVYCDVRKGLLKTFHLPGIRSRVATASEVNRYLRRKFFAHLPPLTAEDLVGVELQLSAIHRRRGGGRIPSFAKKPISKRESRKRTARKSPPKTENQKLKSEP